MVLTRSRNNSASRATQQPVDTYATAGEQSDGTMPTTAGGHALFVDVRSSTPPLAGPPSAGASAPSPPPLYGRELPGYSQMPQHGHAPPVATPQPPMPAPIVMTDQQLVFLLQALRSQPPTQGAQPPPTTTVSTNLANCTARFNGSGDVMAFVDAVQIYKDCVGVHDDMALRGLPMLLTDFAATWWQGVKHSVTSWQEATHLFRQTFGPRLPPHRLYREMFSREQGDERTDIFVCRVRALIAQLPLHTLPENPVQLDMVYGLLHRRIRERVTRSAFTSFAELLQQARVVEDVLEEVCTAAPTKRHTPASTAPPPLPPPHVTGHVATSSPDGAEVNKEEKAPPNKARPRCTFCKMFGHVKDDCRKLENRNKATAEPVKSEPVATRSELRPSVACFGCGAPGVIRSNCTVCKESTASPTTTTAFQSVSVDAKVLNPRVRPIFYVQIFGAVGTALLDTGAKQCVASDSLTKHLRANGQIFNSCETELRFADGTQRRQTVETAVVNVKVQGVAVSTLFMVLPGATDSLLGMNFIKDAGMILDFERNRFSLRATGFHVLQYEREDQVAVSSTIGLHECEGILLPPSDRGKLAALLEVNADIFSAGGGPTPIASHRINTVNAAPIATLPYRLTPEKKEKIKAEIDENSDSTCDLCPVSVDLPHRSSEELRAAQLEDPELRKILTDFEDGDATTRWTDRGYYLSNGVLFRFDPDSESEEPQLVVPDSVRTEILKALHDAPTAGHLGLERTLTKIKERFYFPNMRQYVAKYLKACDLCQKFKPTNLKPAGLLQTPVAQQRFEVLAMDLFGPLPEGSKGEKWIFLVEDTASRWVELFPLTEANADSCARVLIEEVFMRYGFPRRVISDNGTQFVSAVMQKAMHVLGVHQNLTPVYHPEANPAERKNREMKQMLAILIDPEHRRWPEVLPAVRFALNTAPNQGPGHSAAFLTFAREFRSPVDVAHDLRAVVDQENYVPQITPYLRDFVHRLQEVKWRVERQQDIRKDAADKNRRPGTKFQEGDLVLVDSHRLSQSAKGFTSKFAPRREGPYRISKVVSATTYEVVDKESEPRGKYHASLLTPYVGDSDVVVHGRKKGRPRKLSVAKPAPEPSADLEGEDIARPLSTPRTSRIRRVPARLRD